MQTDEEVEGCVKELRDWERVKGRHEEREESDLSGCGDHADGERGMQGDTEGRMTWKKNNGNSTEGEQSH